MSFFSNTRSIHAGRDDLSQIGVHAVPLDFSTTYPIQDLQNGANDLGGMAHGHRPQSNPIYARLHNPTVARFEDAMAQIEGADAGIAFASGMAAITAALMAAKQKGNHIIAVRPLYGGTDHLLASGLLGLEVDWATLESVPKMIREDTSLIIAETPANPSLQLLDISRLVELAGPVPVMIDSTFATPVLQNPIALGAHAVVHSATKYLGGHGDVMGGIVVTNEEWATTLRSIRVATGAVLHPFAGYQLHRGLQTLGARVRTAQANAILLAQKLKDHCMTSEVYFPGFPECDPHGLVQTQMRGPGAMIAFCLPTYEAAAKVMQSVRLLTPAVSLGSVDTLIQHPASLTHQVVDNSVKDELGITPGMLRISVGLEDMNDLWEDLSQALDKAQSVGKKYPALKAVGKV